MTQDVLDNSQRNAEAIDLWHVCMDAVEAMGERALSAARKAGSAVAASLLAPLFARAWQDLQESGMLDALHEIIQLTRLDVDWDGAGGRPATERAKELAIGILISSLVTRRAGTDCSRPAVSTSGAGDISLSWSNDRRRLLVIIYGETAFDDVVCVTQDGDADPERAVVPATAVSERLDWTLQTP